MASSLRLLQLCIHLAQSPEPCVLVHSGFATIGRASELSIYSTNPVQNLQTQALVWLWQVPWLLVYSWFRERSPLFVRFDLPFDILPKVLNLERPIGSMTSPKASHCPRSHHHHHDAYIVIWRPCLVLRLKLIVDQASSASAMHLGRRSSPYV